MREKLCHSTKTYATQTLYCNTIVNAKIFPYYLYKVYNNTQRNATKKGKRYPRKEHYEIYMHLSFAIRYDTENHLKKKLKNGKNKVEWGWEHEDTLYVLDVDTRIYREKTLSYRGKSLFRDFLLGTYIYVVFINTVTAVLYNY